MSTQTAIANIAITELAGDPINDIQEDSKAAKKCLARYDDIRDAVLRMHNWKCAKKRIILPASGAPAFGFAKRFALPADPYCLRVIDAGKNVDYKVEGRYILSDNTGPLYVRFIGRIPEYEMDALLLQAIGCRLGMAIAYSLTTSRDETKRMEKMFKDTIREARSVDAMEDSGDYEGEESEILQAYS